MTENIFHILSLHNLIHKSMFQQKFGSLKSLWQLLMNGLLDDTRSGKSNKCFRLCQYDISQRSKAGCDTSGSWVCQDGNVKQACLTVTFQCRRSFCHLHERSHSFLHSGSAGAGENDDRKFFFRCSLHCSCNLFAYHISHAGCEKTTVHNHDHSFVVADHAFSCHHCFIQTGFFF